MITIHENLNFACVCNECHIQWPMLTVGIPCFKFGICKDTESFETSCMKASEFLVLFLGVVCCSCCSIGSLGANNSWACVSDVLVEKATLLGTTNGVRIKTWQVMHGIFAKWHGNLDSSSLFLNFEGKGRSQKEQYRSTTFCSSVFTIPCSFVSNKPGRL